MVEPTFDVDMLMDVMPDGVMVLDAQCRIRRWSRALAELTGYTEDEAAGQSCAFLECRDPRTAERLDLERQCVSARAAGDAIRHVECLVRGKSGADIPVMKNGRVLRDATGQATGFVETLTDLRPVKRLEQELTSARGAVAAVHGPGDLVGGSPAMQEVYRRIRLAAATDVTVLIEGETGTGKELVARAIHALSDRRAGPLVTVNCSALAENLIESELFGHVKGAFTGAGTNQSGRLELAHGGTLFLDEIGDLSPLLQLKLLRVLQEHQYERVGDATPRHADVRFIAATHRNLKERVAKGRFREDFYYRVRVFTVTTPPLRERKDDIPHLCAAFMAKLNQRTGRRIQRLSAAAQHCLLDYCWPGNVRELENAIEHAFVTCTDDCLEREDLPAEVRTAQQRQIACAEPPGRPARQRAGAPTAAPAVPLTRALLVATLNACAGNRSEAARRLGVNRTTIWRLARKWGLGAGPSTEA